MTVEQIEAIGPEFTGFLRPFERFFRSPPNVRHFRNYTRGLLTDLIAKTGENVRVRRFSRFEVGEGLEKRADDFVAEVQKQASA